MTFPAETTRLEKVTEGSRTSTHYPEHNVRSESSYKSDLAANCKAFSHGFRLALLPRNWIHFFRISQIQRPVVQAAEDGKRDERIQNHEYCD